MSKNSFKVKNGLTLNPIDPSEIVNPQAGDLIADSTDDNKIKRYDATSADWSSVGGSAGIGGNLMSEFEKLTPDLVNVTSAVDTVTFLPIDDNNKSIKATWSGSVGSIQFQASIDSSLHEIQGTVSVWIRTSLQNIQISSVQDDVKLSTLPVSGTGKWKQYELPVVIGGAEMGFIVESTTGVTGDVYIDQPFVGLTPSSYGFEVAQAEYFGNVKYASTAACNWLTSSTTFTNFSADNDCATPVSTGRIQSPSTKIPAIVLPAGSPAGTYQFIAKGMFYKGGGVTQYAGYRFSDGINHSSGVNNLYLAVQTLGSIEGSITYSSALTVDTTINIQAFTLGGTAEIYASNNSGDMAIDVYYYPPKSTIVTQTQEETVQTANEFSAKISSTGVVLSQNLDWINGTTCPIVGVNRRCTLNDLGLTSPMSCVVSAENVDTTQANTVEAEFEAVTTTYIDYNATISGVGNNNIQVSIICQKQGADYNKSRLIVGQFEQIKSTELYSVVLQGTNGDTIDANVENIQFEVFNDPDGLWDTGARCFTVPADGAGYYSISGNVRFTAVLDPVIYLYVDSGSGYTQGHALSGTIGPSQQHHIQGVVYLNAGDKLAIRTNTTGVLQNVANLHNLVIKQEPNLQAIVKNLNPSNVKCQTKFLSASTSTTGVLADLTFNNLQIGKKYRVRFQHAFIWNATGQAVSQVNILNGGVKKCGSLGGGQHNNGNGNFFTGCFEEFTATSNTLTFDLTSSTTSFILGSTTDTNRTNVMLCELPDTYIETDEW